MKKLLVALAAALVLAFPASAAKKPHPHTLALVGPTSLTIQSQDATSVTFAVNATSDLENELYSVWVANVCHDTDGVTVSAEYLPVVWDQDSTLPTSGVAGPFATDGTNPGNAGPIVDCGAFLWMFPDAWTPLDGFTLTYPV